MGAQYAPGDCQSQSFDIASISFLNDFIPKLIKISSSVFINIYYYPKWRHF